MRRTIYIFILLPILFKGQAIVAGDTVSVGIIYKNIRDTLLPFVLQGTSFCDIDIDNDNINDIKFSHAHAGSMSLSQVTKKVFSLSNLEFVLTPTNTYADSIAIDSLIDKSLNWKNLIAGPNLRYTVSVFIPPPGSYSAAGEFIGANNYLGFRKITATDTIYGWFLLDMTNTIKIKSFAYTAVFTEVSGENYTNKKIFLYPNPCSEKLFLKNISNTEIKKYSLLGLDGQEISLNQTGKEEYDISKLSSGLYFLQLQTNEGVLTKKIVVSK